MNEGQTNDSAFSAFGYRLLRQDLLKELLGEDMDKILYWAGKSLARKYPQSSIDSISQFFREASWGVLEVTKEKKDEITFQLSPFIVQEDKSYRLEAGFLAEAIQQFRGCISESIVQVKKKEILFTVQSDLKDPI